MALSRNYTGQRFWAEVVRNFGEETSQILEFESVYIINRAQLEVVGAFSPLLYNSYLTTAALSYSGDSFSLSGYNFQRVGEQIKLSIKSSETPTIEPVSVDELAVFRPDSDWNKKKIVWALVGDTGEMKKGTGLSGVSGYSGYGALTAYYPRVPTQLTALTDYVDLPDGPAINLAIGVAKKILQERLNKPPTAANEFPALVQQLYAVAGLTPSTEEIKEKVKALS